jgi:hypothetical protein
MRVLGWVVVALSSLLVSGGPANSTWFPEAPPPLSSRIDRDLVRLRIVVDDAFVEAHGESWRSFIQEAVAIHNVEWRRIRREWFSIDEIVVEPASGVRDASWTLATLMQRTIHEPGMIHVKISGEPLFVYSDGVAARAIGGLAYRGSDAVVLSVTRGVPVDLAAYYLFHEIGHCWEAFDLPFGGGHSTFGSKRSVTFEVDAGNVQIMEDSRGPRPRDSRAYAPALLRARLAAARSATRDPALFRKLHDLMLHEPSPANSEYVRKRNALLAQAGPERKALSSFIRKYEITPQQARQEAAARAHLAEQYWIANDAIARGDVKAAATALDEIGELHGEHADVHFLVAAVEKKVRQAARVRR